MVAKEPPSNTSFRGWVAPAEAIEGNPQAWLACSIGAIDVQALTAGEQTANIEQEPACLAATKSRTKKGVEAVPCW
jgi:hypothetical protein